MLAHKQLSIKSHVKHTLQGHTNEIRVHIQVGSVALHVILNAKPSLESQRRNLSIILKKVHKIRQFQTRMLLL